MPNAMKDRDVTFSSAIRFLILDPAFPLRAVLSHWRCAPLLVLRRLSPMASLMARVPAVDPQPGWQYDSDYASMMQGFAGEVF